MTKNYQLLDAFKAFYKTMSDADLKVLGDIYSDDIRFVDPVHEIVGLHDVRAYFEATLKNCTYCHFDINECVLTDGSAYVHWVMTFSHPKLKSGKAIDLQGISHIKFTDKIYFHRDYYDLGAMLYEHIPVLGRVLKNIKSKLSS